MNEVQMGFFLPSLSPHWYQHIVMRNYVLNQKTACCLGCLNVDLCHQLMFLEVVNFEICK